MNEALKHSVSPEFEVEMLFSALLKVSPVKNKCFAVGGYCRDQLLGLGCKDLDIVVEINGGAKLFTHWLHDTFPNEISNAYELGQGYPIWHVAFKQDIVYNGVTYQTAGAEIDVADTQKESFPDPETRQRITEYGTLEDDSKRRDFSVNMLLKDLTTGKFVDITGVSIQDIKDGVLRGHPKVDLNKIFSDDPLRMIRCARFFAKYDWEVPLSVLRTIRKNAFRIEIVSVERIMDELKKLGKIPQGFYRAIRFMKATGLLKFVLPEIQAMSNVPTPEQRKVETRGIHCEGDILAHTLEVLKNAMPTFEDQMSALLHDVGKPSTMEVMEDKIAFLGHDDAGGLIAEEIMKRLKFDSDTIQLIKRVVVNHMNFHNMETAGTKGKRRFVREHGDILENLIHVGIADINGTLVRKANGNIEPNEIPFEVYDELRELKNTQLEVSEKVKPILNGLEIMDLLKVKPSKIVGEVSQFLLDLYDEFGQELTKEFAMEKVLEKFKRE